MKIAASFFLTLGLLAVLAISSGCSAVEGTGRGVEAVGEGTGHAISGTGEAISSAARDAEADWEEEERERQARNF